eukprot:5413147-Prymnesium_polylepis.1
MQRRVTRLVAARDAGFERAELGGDGRGERAVLQHAAALAVPGRGASATRTSARENEGTRLAATRLREGARTGAAWARSLCAALRVARVGGVGSTTHESGGARW